LRLTRQSNRNHRSGPFIENVLTQNQDCWCSMVRTNRMGAGFYSGHSLRPALPKSPGWSRKSPIEF
jgi:hypothetical protein